MDENALLHRIIEILQHKKEYQLQTSGIRTQEMYVLERIYLNKRTTPKHISEKYSISPSTLTGVIDRLENRGLIRRVRTDRDRRSTELITTDKGSLAVEKHIAEDEIFTTNLFSTLETEKREKLKELLGELLDKVRTESLFSPKKQ